MYSDFAATPATIQTLIGSVWRNNIYVLSFQSTEFNPVTFKSAMKAAL